MKFIYYQLFPTLKWVLTREDRNKNIDRKCWAVFDTQESLFYFCIKADIEAHEKDQAEVLKSDYNYQNP